MQSMQSRRAVLCTLVVAGLGLAAFAAPAAFGEAAGYPTKPVRVVVGFGAGGGTDLTARHVMPRLAELLGQPVVIENRTGAGGRIAVDYVQGQPADGYTLLTGAIGQLAVSTAIYPKLSFHPTRTLVPLTMLASYPLVIAVPAGSGIKSIDDLVAWGKANPGKANYPSASPIFTITSEMFKMKTGMPGQMIPYRSTAEMLLSIVTGQTTFAISDSASVVTHVKSGKVRALAVANPTRISELPDTPTMSEVGLGDIPIGPQWIGAFAAAGTPPAVVKRLEADLRRALTDDGVRKRIRAMTYYPGGQTGDEFRKIIDADINAFRDVVASAKLKFE